MILFSTVVSVSHRNLICSTVQSGRLKLRFPGSLRVFVTSPLSVANAGFDFFVSSPCITNNIHPLECFCQSKIG
jgi:hypothetical protein